MRVELVLDVGLQEGRRCGHSVAMAWTRRFDRDKVLRLGRRTRVAKGRDDHLESDCRAVPSV